MKDLQKADVSQFWYWMNERHAIYLKREVGGHPKPWTVDPVLLDYKFTNVYRQLDRGTKWLTENFLTTHSHPEKHEPDCLVYDDAEGITWRDCECGAAARHLELVAFNICWYRMFNWTGTGQLLGWQTESWEDPDVRAVVKLKLHAAYDRGEQVFTNAHIVYSPPGESKIDAITDVCGQLAHCCFTAGALATHVMDGHATLQNVFEQLTEVHCVGPFMGYEMVTDMRHTRLLRDAPDIMTWANPGPGAIRGLRRLGLPHQPRRRAIDSIRSLLVLSQMDHHGGKVLGEHMKPLEMRDVEHSLCEFDKYCRVKFGEGEPRMKFNGRA